jgi:hypothetical protein
MSADKRRLKTRPLCEAQPRLHRYTIGARRLPDLRKLRAALAGRAIHCTIERVGLQVDRHLR